MAGGKGERLHPLTADCPKPLLPLAGEPIVGYMVKRLRAAGVKHFTFCVNYLAEQIAGHFGNGDAWKAEFEYLLETEPLGTIGGAALKDNFHYEDLLVVNGDLLTTIHFDRFYAYYLEEDAHLAIATIPYRVNLPYGILELDADQVVQGVREKPTFTYHINSGIYMMRRELIDLIPRNTRFDAIDLIEAALDKGLKVVSYPLHDYWIDIGQIEDYRKAQEDILFLDL